jgi:hypothetical protein
VTLCGKISSLRHTLPRAIICLLSVFFSITFPIVAQEIPCNGMWDETIQLSSDSVISISPRIASDGKNIHVIWYGLDTLGTERFSGIQYTQSTDSGKTFSAPRTVLSPNVALSPGYIACAGNNVFVVCMGIANSIIGTLFIQSSDGGSTWDTPVMIQKKCTPRFLVADDSLLYVQFGAFGISNYGLLCRRTNGGVWNSVNLSMQPLDNMVISGSELHGIGNLSFGIHAEVAYYYSINSGSSWIGPEIISLEDGISSMYPHLAIAPNQTRYVTWIEPGAIILRQSDGYDDEGFLLWKPQRTLIQGPNVVSATINIQRSIVAVTWEEQTGDTTIIMNSSSPNNGKTFCPPVAPTGGIHAGEHSSLLIGSTLEIVWSEERYFNKEIFYRRRQISELDVPDATSLLQNYPNPAEGQTFIRYNLAMPTYVSLRIYNLLGQQITTLIDQFQEEGTYTITWNDPHLASGVYFYRLSTPTSSETKKLIKLR